MTREEEEEGDFQTLRDCSFRRNNATPCSVPTTGFENDDSAEYIIQGWEKTPIFVFCTYLPNNEPVGVIYYMRLIKTVTFQTVCVAPTRVIFTVPTDDGGAKMSEIIPLTHCSVKLPSTIVVFRNLL